MFPDSRLLEALPVAVYTTDSEGCITFYNDAAATFWGYRPDLGSSKWCGSWRLYWPDGRPMPHDECPMAVTLKEGHPVRDAEAIAERPDGSRVSFTPYPTLLRDETGQVTGAVNLLIDLTERKRSDLERARLAAIVSSSDDGIISKRLDGIITSWNAGAVRIFGYEPDEIIGQPITRLIPEELLAEEADIIAHIQDGERVPHYETVRLAKSGRRVDVSLTVSPLFDRDGRVIGASKIARDITERKQSEDLQKLLFEELNHRVKNSLATIQAIATQSLQKASTPQDFVTSFNGRVEALARAHELLVQGKMTGADVGEIVREQVVLGEPSGSRIRCSGPYVNLDSRVAVQLALVLHELATNARKYGALSTPSGFLSIDWKLDMQAGRTLTLEWKESGVPDVRAPDSHGFGTILIERTVKAHGGDASIQYGAEGVICDIRLPLPAEDERSRNIPLVQGEEERSKLFGTKAPQSLRGRHILVIEDEPLVAMDTEAHLVSAGCNVVGPAATVDEAKRLIDETVFDAALLDANLGGDPVDEVAAALTRKGIPFAFATGYGREALPHGFRDRPVITKPFRPNAILSELEALLAMKRPSSVVPLRPKKR